jgi:uncharacterized glyoxalase superfamily protein PhnB
MTENANPNSATTSGNRPFTGVWPSFRYRDATAAIRFLTEAFGFEAVLVVPGDADREVHHAELRWPLGGGVMLGTATDDGTYASIGTGHGFTYVVTDAPDALYARAVKAGATVVRELGDTDYGSRDFIVTDPEGNHWSFGTYAGE